MKDMLIAIFICGLMLFNFAQAKPVLVAVELNSQNQIQQWRRFNYPTYEFIAKTAISEVDDSQLLDLKKQGFFFLVIDESPWSERYFVSSVSADVKKDLPGDVIWQRGNILLIKVPTQEITTLFNMDLKFQPLRKIILPERFWKQILTKKVSIKSISWDPFIQSIVDQVSTDSLTAFIQRLQDFKTRLTHSDSSFAASQWMFDKMSDWGYMTEFDSFYVDSSMAAWGYWPDTGYERNVIATIDGAVNPSKIMIICGHFDAIVWWDTALARINAPGADDNATGTVAALEAARIFRNYSWDPTIQFIAWATEELGLYGSYHYARTADSLGYDIGGVINGDMLGYMDDVNLDCIIQRKDSSSLWLSNLFAIAGQTYVPSLIIYPVTSSGGSDWYPFAVYGYASVGSAEAANSHWNPYYHYTTDLLNTLTPELYTAITQTSVATMAILGLYPSSVEDVVVADIGDGLSLEVQWTSSPETDIIGYNVYWGLASEVYTDSHFVAGASVAVDTLTGLMTDSTYYIIVRAQDTDDRESYVATEVTGSPRVVPLPPNGVIATPIVSGVRIDWLPNTELDLAGYRVYRRINESSVYDSLNTILLADTTYTNAPLSGENKYYYAVRAFDTSGYASPMSSEAYGRPITLDQGILIVDETRNGTNPPDSLQDNFYRYVMQDYPYTEYEYGSSAEKPVMSDFAPYSTIVWFADDYAELMASGSVSEFISYLDVGGNLWFTGWKPTANLREQQTYPVDFNPGDFIYDYLKIAHVEISLSSASFQGADGLLGYPRLDVDSAKVPLPPWGGTMRYIEALTSVSSAEDIYTMDMTNNSSPFEGSVCGLRYLGTGYKTVFFGYPLYFMDQDQARLVAQKVMDDFGEVYIEEEPIEMIQVSELRLYQNRPNPFRNKTDITFSIGQGAKSIDLKIYDVTGRLVRQFDHTTIRLSDHISWDGNDNAGRVLPNGVYFYQLNVDDQSIIKKLIMLR